MGLKTVFEGKTQRLEVLSPEGCVDRAVSAEIPQEVLLDVYRKMVEVRLFDERAIKLQRQGRLGTYPSILGQEAAQVVPPLCLEPRDWLVPSYRSTGVYYARGMKLRYALLYWAGDDRGFSFPEKNNDMGFSITVGGHLSEAVGLAWAAKLKKEGAACLAYLGDGGSSKGDFHEAMTFAGALGLPVVFVIENNHWAISMPRERQCAARTLAQKSDGYGVFGLQVDGNDALAVYQAVASCVARARRGSGPSLLELETYRMSDHTTADDASRYRPAKDVESWARRDPVSRLRRYLERLGIWNADREAELRESAAAMIDEEIKAAESFPEPNPLDLFAYNYARAPRALVEQRAELAALLERRGREPGSAKLPPPEGRFP